MKAIKKGIFFIIAVSCLAGCSRKNDTFLNRNWHAITAEYNTLYNGHLALEQGRQELNSSYFDNFWKLLPVERMEVSEEVFVDEEERNSSFQIAEEKAIKAIQKHSMLIDGREKNPQIDEAYLLLGKARYFDQRFVPALEAFNFVLHKYPLSNTINQARIWREKTHIRMEFEEVAIENLKSILEQESLEDQDRADAAAILAQAYINLSHKDSAVAPITQAAAYTKSNEEKGRYLFIKGQLYNLLEKRDSASMAFEEVIDMNRKIPRAYLINAQLSKNRNLLASQEGGQSVLEQLEELREDRENRDFLDRIYFEIAEYHNQSDSLKLAVEFYNRSLRQPSNDRYLQSLNYQNLGNIHFEQDNFPVAGAYYDSTLTQLNENSRDFRSVKRRRDNLEDVIYYEAVAQTNDSILRLTALPEEEQLAFFTTYTQELKEKATLAEEEETSTAPGMGNFSRNAAMPPGVPNPANSFYFYNPSTVAYGREEFLRTWGERSLGDNWRNRELSRGQWEEEEMPADQDVAFESNPLFDPYTYLETLPTDPRELDSIKRDRNFANYQLGLLYFDKFAEPGLAIERLETLLDSDPEERLILPAKYHLYKVYQETGAAARALSVKNDILHQYPDSRYAAIIENPGEVIEAQNLPEDQYKALYSQYREQEFQEVITESDNLAQQYMGEPIVPKFRLLQAMAVGRLHGFEAYKEALNAVALDFPQSEEGKKAERMLSESLQGMEDTNFKAEGPESSFKIIFAFQRLEEEKAEAFRDRLEETISDLDFRGVEVSRDVYSPEEIFVVVHGFSTSGRAEYFMEQVSNQKELLIPEKYFYISTPNYRIVQIHKNIETYLATNPPN